MKQPNQGASTPKLLLPPHPLTDPFLGTDPATENYRPIHATSLVEYRFCRYPATDRTAVDSAVGRELEGQWYHPVPTSLKPSNKSVDKLVMKALFTWI